MEERKRVEQYFLNSAERQQKVRFAQELMERAATERGVRRVVAPEPARGFLESVRAFWRSQPVSIRTAVAMATLVIVVGLAFVMRSVIVPTSGTDALVALNLSTSDRASGAEVQSVKLEPGTRRLRIELKLPGQTPQVQNYRVELLNDQQQSRNLSIEERTGQSLIVAIPANEIAPGGYIIRLYGVNPDGSEQRVRGNYYFNVL